MSSNGVRIFRNAPLPQSLALVAIFSIPLILGLAGTPGASAEKLTAKSGTDQFRVTGSGGGWLPHKPTAADKIAWVWGDNLADGQVFPEGSVTETKFDFPPPGDPTGKTFVGMDHTDTGPLGSTATGTGSGFSAVATGFFWDSYKVSWTITAKGHAVPKGNFTSQAEAKDPISLRYPELPPPSTPVDLFIPITIGPMTHGAGGFSGCHVSLETAGGSTDLLELQFSTDGLKVIGATPGVSFFRLDSLNQADFHVAPTGLPATAADLKAAIAGAMAGGDLPVGFNVGIMMSGFVVPSSALADGGAIDLHLDTWAQESGAQPGFSLKGVANRVIPPGGGGLFVVPERAPEVDLSFPPDGPPFGPGSHNGDVSLYGQLPDLSWSFMGTWDWNPGTLHAFVPPPGMRLMELVSCANSEPVQGIITFPVTSLTTPPLFFPINLDPSFALGGLELSNNPFNPTLGMGGGAPPIINLMPGLSLNTIPQYVGANHWQYIPVQFNLQPDPSRPWLYVGGNPTNPLMGSTYLEIQLDGLFDAAGNPLGTLPLQIDFQQGALHVPLIVQAVRDAMGNIQVPTIDLGQIRSMPYLVSIGVPAAPSAASRVGTESAQGAPPAPGYISMRAISVVSAPFGTTGVGAAATSSALRVGSPGPNPFTAITRVGFELPAREAVRVDVLDASGRRVWALASGNMEAGAHSVSWDGRRSDGSTVPGGIYFVRLAAGGSVETRKVAWVR